jgi:hypothetical protein
MARTWEIILVVAILALAGTADGGSPLAGWSTSPSVALFSTPASTLR